MAEYAVVTLRPSASGPQATLTLLGVPVTIGLWFVAIAVVLGLFGGRSGLTLGSWVVVATLSVLAHEVGHATAFRAFGVQPRIFLTGFFGLTYGEELRPLQNLLVSLAGPLTGIAIGGLALAADFALRPTGTAAVVLGDAVWVNLGWGLFNLLPLMPLDGGSVMASILQGAGRPRRDALLLSLSTAAAVVGASLVVGSAYVAVLVAWLAASNLEELQGLRDDPLRYQMQRHAEALLDGETEAAIDGLADVERRARSQAVIGWANAGLAFALLAADRWQEAEDVSLRHPWPASQELLRRSIESRRNGLDPELVAGLASCRTYTEAMGVVRAIQAGGHLDQVIEQANELPARTQNAALYLLQIGLHHLREYEASIRVGELLFERQQRWSIVPFWIGLDHASLGQIDRAIAWLKIAADHGFGEAEELEDSRLDQLRALPAFEEIRRRIAANPDRATVIAAKDAELKSTPTPPSQPPKPPSAG